MLLIGDLSPIFVAIMTSKSVNLGVCYSRDCFNDIIYFRCAVKSCKDSLLRNSEKHCISAQTVQIDCLTYKMTTKGLYHCRLSRVVFFMENFTYML